MLSSAGGTHSGAGMLVDTNIVSYFHKRSPLAAPYEKHLQGRILYVSFMTVAELYKWPFERAGATPRKQQLVDYLKNYTVLPWDNQLAWTWSEFVVKREKAGRKMSWEDSWIAATALRHRLPVVTHNRKHFEGIEGLQVISESE